MFKALYTCCFILLFILSGTPAQAQPSYIDSLTQEALNGATDPDVRKSLLFYHSGENNSAELTRLASKLPSEKAFLIPSFRFEIAAKMVDGDTVGAYKFINQLIEDSGTDKDYKTQVELYARLGILYAIKNNRAGLVRVHQRIKKMSDSLDYLNGRVLSSILKAELFLLKKQQSKALIAAKEAEEFSEIARNTDKKAAKKVLAKCLLHDHQPERAIAIYSALIKKLMNKNLLPEAGALNLVIADIHNRYNSPKNAETYFLSAYGVFNAAKMKVSAAQTLFHLGQTWRKTDPPKALQYAQRAINSFSVLGLHNETGKAHRLAGDLYFEQTLYDRALESYNSASENFKTAGNFAMQSHALLEFAQIQASQNRSDIANRYFAQSLDAAKKARRNDLHVEILKGHIAFKERSGKDQNVLRLKKELTDLQDSLKQGDYRAKIEKLEVALAKASENLDKEKSRYTRDTDQLIERNRELGESVLTNQIIYFISLVFFSLLIIYGAYKRILLKREKTKLQTTLEELDEETDKLIKSQDALNYKISGYLSDGTAKTLAGVKHTFSSFFDELTFETPMKQVRYKQALEYLEEAEDEVFQLAETALPKKLKDQGIIVAFPDLCDSIFGDTSLTYEFDYFGISTKDRLKQTTEINCFQIVKELLQNILQHSSAKNVKLKVFKQESLLKIIIEDDGKVFQPNADHEPEKGTGLAVLRSRCRLIKAALTYEARAPKGTLTALSLSTE